VDDLELALAAARAGARVVADAFGSSPIPEMKGRNDPVTEIDRRAERAIVGLIRAHRPDDGFLAEESGGTIGAGRQWIVDPLDGTVNFVHGIPQVAVSVALYEGDIPLVGVIEDPLRGEVFAAAAGIGATMNGAPIAVSSAGLAGAVVATGFPYDHDRYAEQYAGVLGAVLARIGGLRRFGSAALDLAWTAAGRYEGYWELGVAPWDQAAGTLIVRRAGGIVTDPWGAPASPATRLIVAGNPVMHAELTEIVLAHLPAHLAHARG
jgi:myo-inositol-1(or 4)-monophosphatase